MRNPTPNQTRKVKRRKTQTSRSAASCLRLEAQEPQKDPAQTGTVTSPAKAFQLQALAAGSALIAKEQQALDFAAGPDAPGSSQDLLSEARNDLLLAGAEAR